MQTKLCQSKVLLFLEGNNLSLYQITQLLPPRLSGFHGAVTTSVEVVTVRNAKQLPSFMAVSDDGLFGSGLS